MSTLRSARRKAVSIASFRCGGDGGRLLVRFFSFSLIFILFLASPVHASDTIVARIVLNHQEQGDFFVELMEDGDFLIKKSDLVSMGFTDIGGEERELQGEPYLSLRSLREVEYAFDEDTLTISIEAHPSLLSTKTVDFITRVDEDTYRPRGGSAFLNYSLSYFDTDESDTDVLTLNNEVGIKSHGVLFLTETLYRRDSDDDFVRLFSSFTHDREEGLQRLVVGDFVSRGGILGSSGNLGGISFSKEYRIDPYLIKYPLLDISGFVTRPSEMEVYVNGSRLYADSFSPGEFELKNLSSFNGAGVAELVIRDPYGREERLRYPFYFATDLLREGLHEYSYGFGFQRQNLGVESNSYQRASFSLFHNYGVNDSLTIGGSAEGASDYYNAGPQSRFRLEDYGVFSLALLGSRDEDLNEWGSAGQASYAYQGRKFSANANFTGFSEEFVTMFGPLPEPVKYIAGGGAGYFTGNFGLFSANYSVQALHDGEDRHIYSISYSKNFLNRATLTARFTGIEDDGSDYIAFVGLTYQFNNNIHIVPEVEITENSNTQRFEVRNIAPLGEGFRYRAAVARAEEDNNTTYVVNPELQYNARFGTYRGEFQWEDPEGADSRYAYTLTASGGIGYVGGTLGLSRPIQDGFGLVKVGELEDVRVFVNSQDVGTTDSEGKIFVPALSSYTQNQITIGDEDVPIDYLISDVFITVSPALRSGAIIDFGVQKFQAVTGKLFLEDEGERIPVEYSDLIVLKEGQEVVYPTARGGEFYIENIEQGTHRAYLEYDRKTCRFDLVIPPSEETLIDLGDVVCRVGPEKVVHEPVPSEEPLPEEEPEPVAAEPLVTEIPESAEVMPAEEPAPQEADEDDDAFYSVLVVESGLSFVQDTEELLVPDVEKGFLLSLYRDYVGYEGTVHFFFDSTDILGEDEDVLMKIFRLLDYNDILRAEIEGHAAEEGTVEYNLELGMRRAFEVKSRLMEFGVPEWRITRVESYGEGRRVCLTLDHDCRQRNQRASIRLVVGEPEQ
jgi:outer membrane usher protein FimD/PapC/outer membrane protein OmpA-like peptidoglycan-associated protein